MRNDERFLSMLEYTRPHEGKSEAEYLERFIRPNCDWVDGGGNHIKIIGQSVNRGWKPLPHCKSIKSS